MRKPPTSIEQLPESVPIFPLARILLLPRVLLPLNIFEPRYLAMVDDALRLHKMIGIIQPQEEEGETLCQNGCLGRIVSFQELEDDRLHIALTGVCRFSVAKEIQSPYPYRQICPDFKPFADDLGDPESIKPTLRQGILDIVRQYLDAHDMNADWESLHNATDEELVNSLSVISPFTMAEKQALLEASSLTQRADVFVALAEKLVGEAEGESPVLQ